MARLRSSGLLLAPFAAEWGGADLGRPEQAGQLFDVLRLIGGGDLSVGRLYEGHVNAVALVRRYGTPAPARALAEAVGAGAMSGVWNAEGAGPPDLDGRPRRRLASRAARSWPPAPAR